MATFQKVYEEYAQPVYRFLLSLTGNDDLAKELLSETFTKRLGILTDLKEDATYIHGCVKLEKTLG